MLSYVLSQNLIFSCPKQFNRGSCHWLTNSRYFYFWHTKSDPRDLWPLRHLIRVMRRHDLTAKFELFETFFFLLFWNFFGTFLELFWNIFGTFLELFWNLFGTSLELLWNFFGTNTMTKTILETCGICDTDYNSDNWESEFMTIFATCQSRVTLDSIRNSCDVFLFCAKK